MIIFTLYYKLTMIEPVNLSKLFIQTHNEIISKYKKNNGSIKHYTPQLRYSELYNFVYKECYWSRHNVDNSVIDNHKDKNTDINIPDHIPGKYLNEIHLFYVKYGLYDSLYAKLVNIWLQITNFETLSTVSQDSAFVRNLIGTGCKRNPQYYNKPGYKVHVITDSKRVPISIAVTNCTNHDSNFVTLLLKNKIIDDDIFNNKVKTFLADSAYSTLSNLHYLTDLGIGVTMGRNKQHIAKNTIVDDISKERRGTYGKRCSVENFFANIERYPCLINNYEKTAKSYAGLLTFALCIILTNKINTYILESHNDAIKKSHEMKVTESRDKVLKKRQAKYDERKKEEKLKELESKERKIHNDQLIEKINNNIQKYIDQHYIKNAHDKRIKHIKNIPNKFSFEKYSNKANAYIIDYVRHNVLTKTEQFKFAKKTVFTISAEKYAYRDDTIRNKMLNYSSNIICDQLNVFTDIFFGSNNQAT